MTSVKRRSNPGALTLVKMEFGQRRKRDLYLGHHHQKLHAKFHMQKNRQKELQMPRHLSTASLALPVIGCAIICWPAPASAQTAKDLVGTWEFVSIVNTAKDGTKTEPFGSNLKGLFIMGPDGRFAQIVTRAAIPKFASDNRLQGTPEENKAIVQGSIGYFGTYSVDNKVLTLHVEGGTWPSWTGTAQKRAITSYTTDQLTWTLEASVGGSNVTTVKRVK